MYLAKWFQKLNHLIGSIVDRTNVNRTCTGYDEPVNEDYFEVLHQAFIHTDKEFYVFDLYNSILDQAFLNCTKISQDRLKYITNLCLKNVKSPVVIICRGVRTNLEDNFRGFQTNQLVTNLCKLILLCQQFGEITISSPVFQISGPDRVDWADSGRLSPAWRNFRPKLGRPGPGEFSAQVGPARRNFWTKSARPGGIFRPSRPGPARSQMAEISNTDTVSLSWQGRTKI